MIYNTYKQERMVIFYLKKSIMSYIVELIPVLIPTLSKEYVNCFTAMHHVKGEKRLISVSYWLLTEIVQFWNVSWVVVLLHMHLTIHPCHMDSNAPIKSLVSIVEGFLFLSGELQTCLLSYDIKTFEKIIQKLN